MQQLLRMMLAQRHVFGACLLSWQSVGCRHLHRRLPATSGKITALCFHRRRLRPLRRHPRERWTCRHHLYRSWHPHWRSQRRLRLPLARRHRCRCFYPRGTRVLALGCGVASAALRSYCTCGLFDDNERSNLHSSVRVGRVSKKSLHSVLHGTGTRTVLRSSVLRQAWRVATFMQQLIAIRILRNK